MVSASEDAESPRVGVSVTVKGVVSGGSAVVYSMRGFSLPNPPTGTIWLLSANPQILGEGRRELLETVSQSERQL